MPMMMTNPFCLLLVASPASGWSLVYQTAFGLMALGGCGFLFLTRGDKRPR